MKPYWRLIEPRDLSELAKLFRHSFESDEKNKTVVLTEFMNKLLHKLTQNLKDMKLIPLINEPPTFSELYQSYKSEMGRGSTTTSKPYSQHIGSTLSNAAVLEILILEGEFEEALVKTVLLTSKLLTKFELNPSSIEKASWFNFDPLIGEYPQLENMIPSSIGGQLVAVLRKGREIWGNAQQLPEWKKNQALRLKDIFFHVLQYSNRYGNEWAEPEYQTIESPMTWLSSQIEPDLVLKFTRSAYSSICNYDERILESEIFSLFAILRAYDGLHELWEVDDKENNDDRKWAQMYLSEAEGYIKTALDFAAKESSKQGVSMHQQAKRRKRDEWAPVLRRWLFDQKKTIKESNKNNSQLAQNMTTRAIEKRIEWAKKAGKWEEENPKAGLDKWIDRQLATKWLAREIGKMLNNNEPYSDW